MPYRIIDEGSGLVVQFHGTVTFSEIMTATKQAWEYPGWDKHRYHIGDYRNVDTITLDEADPVLFARMDNVAVKATRLVKTAFVANSENIIKLCKKYMESRENENFETQLFADAAEARKWVSS